MIDVVIFVTEDPAGGHPAVSVASTRRADFPGAAGLGGTWTGGMWTFDRTAAAEVEAACRAAFGAANPTPHDVALLYERVDAVAARIVALSDRYLDPPMADTLPGGVDGRSPHEVLAKGFLRIGQAYAPYRKNPSAAPAGLSDLWEAASRLGGAKPRSSYVRATRRAAGVEGRHAGLDLLFLTARRLEEAEAALARVPGGLS